MKRFFLLFLAFLTTGSVADDFRYTWRPLYDLVDPALQVRLEQRLMANSEWQRLVQRKKLAVAVVDMNAELPSFARVNGNQMMYAASLPKIAIMLTAYASFEDGSLLATHRPLHTH